MATILQHNKIWRSPANYLLTICLVTLLMSASQLHAASDKYRLVWTDDPATTMTIGWRQGSGSFVALEYRQKGLLGSWNSSSALQVRSFQNTNNGVSDVLDNSFVKLTGLAPDTDYEFRICDTDGCSDRYMWFRTAPATAEPISFVAGGDSRRESSANFENNDLARVNGFKLVSKLRPLFVLFSGDFMNDGTFSEWLIWLDEWQLTQSSDGRMYPLIPTHGNHENDELDMMRDLFNIEGPGGNSAYGTYNSLGFGGDMLRIWTLNTELEPGVGYSAFTGQSAQAWNDQTAWLSADLAAHSSVNWKLANYHRPLRPHTSGKSEGNLRYADWAPLFDSHDVDLAIESDSHMVKYTYPVNMSSATGSDEGFIEADYLNSEHGTVFIGEGSWGAPKRPIDDDKDWTIVSNSFWQFKHIQVDATNLHVRTVRFEPDSYPNGVDTDVPELAQIDQDASPYALPAGLDLWQPFEGDGPLSLPLSSALAVKADANEVPDSAGPGAPDGAIFWNDFSSGLTSSTYGDMQSYDLGCNDTSTSNWYIYNGTKASINGYNASASDPNENCEDWLILPPQDLSTRNAVTMMFDSDYNYGGPELELFVSSNYDPAINANPSSATWTQLAFNLPATGSYTSAPSGSVIVHDSDFPVSERATVYFAFRYTSTGRGPGDGRIWEVDNVAVLDGEVQSDGGSDLSESFEDGTLGTWQSVKFQGIPDWSSSNTGGRNAATVTNLSSQFAALDTWLVSPGVQFACRH